MINDVWQSFSALPRWVQFWVAAVLVPVNLASLLFIAEPHGLLIATLAVGGMMPNLPIMMIERGFSKAMAWPHIVIWTPLVIYIAVLPGEDLVADSLMTSYLPLLLAVNLVSLGFDYRDARAWLRGSREVAGRS